MNVICLPLLCPVPYTAVPLLQPQGACPRALASAAVSACLVACPCLMPDSTFCNAAFCSCMNCGYLQISCGAEHTVVLTDKGEVWSWGQGEHTEAHLFSNMYCKPCNHLGQAQPVEN